MPGFFIARMVSRAPARQPSAFDAARTPRASGCDDMPKCSEKYAIQEELNAIGFAGPAVSPAAAMPKSNSPAASCIAASFAPRAPLPKIRMAIQDVVMTVCTVTLCCRRNMENPTARRVNKFIASPRHLCFFEFAFAPARVFSQRSVLELIIDESGRHVSSRQAFLGTAVSLRFAYDLPVIFAMPVTE